VFQFVVPKSGFHHGHTGEYWIAVLGWAISLIAAVGLLFISRPYWGFGRGALLLALAVFAIANTWSVMASLPWGTYTAVAAHGQTFNANHKSVLIQTCCTTWDTSNTAGQAGVLWFQAVVPPLLALILGLRRASIRRGLGFISLGFMMFSIPLSEYLSLLPKTTHHASNGFSYSYTDSVTWKVHVMAITSIAIVLLGLGASLWTAASQTAQKELATALAAGD